MKIVAIGKRAADRLKNAPTCHWCHHFFDPADQRGVVYERGEKDPLHSCPACWMMIRSTSAWAGKNDCNGIFDDTLSARRADATAKFNEFDEVRDGDWPDAKVVPVRILEETEENAIMMRRYEESELERVYAKIDAKAAAS